MENEIKIFENEDFGQVRTVIIEGQPWFVGKDVAVILGYSNPAKAIRDHIDDEDKTVNEMFTVNGTKAILINESGLYSLILSSKLETAKKFKHWVTSEILPVIRKTGGYISNGDLFVNTYFGSIPDEQKTLVRGLVTNIEEQQKQIVALNQKVEKDKPLVEFADQIQASEDSIDMACMAKIASKNGIKIGRNNLFRFLRARNVLNIWNEPYQSYMNLDWFEVVESTYKYCGKSKITKTTLVKPKGQIGIVKMLIKYYNSEK